MAIQLGIETQLARSALGKLVSRSWRQKIIPLGDRSDADPELFRYRGNGPIDLQDICFSHAPSMKHA